MSLSSYIIDDNIDFYEELLKDESSDNTENACLLTGMPLEKNYIKLQCSHTFNYEALFNEIHSQKQYNEFNNSRLNVYSIKCPYCRIVINNLLPYIPIIKNKKLHGINYPEKYSMVHKSCSYVFKRGKNKNNTCNKNGFETEADGNICETHWKKKYEIIQKKEDK